VPEGDATQQPWWRGKRGEWYVAIQLVLIAAVFLAPQTLPGLPSWPASLERVGMFAGAALIVAGTGLFLAAVFTLGPNLTPLPRPKPNSTLVQTGPYRLVRHPIYTGDLLLLIGLELALNSWLVVGAIALCPVVMWKAMKEEKMLLRKLTGYVEYHQRTKRFIPFLI